MKQFQIRKRIWKCHLKNCRRFVDIFKFIFVNEKCFFYYFHSNAVTCVPKGAIKNKPTSNMPLFEPMVGYFADAYIHRLPSIYQSTYPQNSNIYLSRQKHCWSLRCSWSITCRRCSNYIFILNLTPGFSDLGKDDCKTGRETFTFWDLMWLILAV